MNDWFRNSYISHDQVDTLFKYLLQTTLFRKGKVVISHRGEGGSRYA